MQIIVLIPGRPFWPSLMLASKGRAYPRVEHPKGASLTLLAKIRLGQKGANTLAYYRHS